MITAFVLVRVGTGEHLNFVNSVKEEMSKLLGVKEVHGIFGRFDLIAKIEARDIEELQRLITDRIRGIKGVLSTESFIVGT